MCGRLDVNFSSATLTVEFFWLYRVIFSLSTSYFLNAKIKKGARKLPCPSLSSADHGQDIREGSSVSTTEKDTMTELDVAAAAKSAAVACALSTKMRLIKKQRQRLGLGEANALVGPGYNQLPWSPLASLPLIPVDARAHLSRQSTPKAGAMRTRKYLEG